VDDKQPSGLNVMLKMVRRSTAMTFDGMGKIRREISHTREFLIEGRQPSDNIWPRKNRAGMFL